MKVNHYGVEFGYELIAVIPFAYWHHLNGSLEETISCKDTRPLYYFSGNHKEILSGRHSKHVRTLMNEGVIPNIYIHVEKLDKSMWVPPPYKEVYANDEFDFDVVVYNKYNVELGGKPANYYPPEVLDEIFTLLEGHNVLYNHMTSSMGYDDKVASLELNEWDVVRSHGHVTTIQDVIDRTGYNYNEAQLKAYANADLFVTLQGGGSIFASYFGGTNIIYAVVGHELKCGAFDNWYHEFGGSKIKHHDNYDSILESIKQWRDEV